MIDRRTLLGAGAAIAWASPLAAASLAGTWRIELDHPGGPLPFGLEISRDGRKAWILNPPERLAVEQVSARGSALVLAFPSYGSEIVLRPEGAGLVGVASLVRRDGPVSLAARGTRETRRFTAQPGSPQPAAGQWAVRTDGARPQAGVGRFRAVGPLVAGSIQFPTGDTRYLAGDLSGGTLRLSTFDGNATSLWIGRIDGDRISGEQWSATSRQPIRWTASRDRSRPADGVAVETVTPVPLRFAFPDSQGRTVSLTDPRYRGKVVLVTTGGAWCPNCHDEARFMGAYAQKRRREGLEVVGLQFEYGDPSVPADRARALRQLDSFAKRYGLDYPLLLAGQPTPDSTRAALPAIGGVRVYPTTLLVDRKGRLREIHVGWAGPATGQLHRDAVAKLDASVTALLREKA